MLSDTERSLLLLGDAQRPLPEPLPLTAGPLTLVYEGGDLRYIRYGDREIIRRIYVALRGEAWLTVPGVLSEVAIETRSDSFYITYQAHYRNEEKGIDFSARFKLSGNPNGTITFDFDGTAHSTFKRNRIGICVLHPAQACSGQPVRVTHTNGHSENGIYPTTIKPDQPFFDIAAIAEEVGDGVQATIRFTGDVFEMEDQRNWSDASFKTYSTPQARPKPVEVAAGTRIHQSVAISLQRSTLNFGDDAFHSDSDAGMRGLTSATSTFVLQAPITVDIAPEPIATFPGFGLVLPANQLPLSDDAEMALHSIRFDHLRTDVPLEGDWHEKIGLARVITQEHEVPLIVGLKNAAQRSEGLPLPPLASGDTVALLSSSGDGLTGDLSPSRKVLPEGVLLVAGSDNNFTELNRNRPSPDGVDGYVFSGTPQVHSFDDLSIMETPPMYAEQLQTAKTFTGNKPIYIGPLTLYRPGKIKAVQQTGIMGAAWYTAALAYAAQGGATRITLCDLQGAQGILSAEGMPYPVYYALMAVGTATGGGTQVTTISDPLKVACLSVLAEGGHWQDIYLVNLQPETVPVRLSGVQGVSARIRTLDETSGGLFSAVSAVPVQHGSLSLNLLPYAVMQVISGSAVY